MIHLITGGSGFLGNLIMQNLLKKGERVRILDIWKDPNIPADVEFILGSVLDQTIVQKAMAGVQVVHHNAALVPLTKSGKGFHQANVIGSQIVAQAALTAKVDAFIHMSSSAIFGTPPCPITDATPLAPIEIYGKSKLAGEMMIQDSFKNTSMPLIVIRPRTILGLGRLGIFQILFKWIQANKNIPIIGDGSNKFQFVHATDLMNLYMIALAHEKPGTYNVGAAEFGTLRAALENLIQFAQSRSRVIGFFPSLTIPVLQALDVMRLSPLAPWHYLTYHKDFYFDITPLKKLGWEPIYSNDAMLHESYQWFLEAEAPTSQAFSPHRKNVPEKILNWVRFFS